MSIILQQNILTGQNTEFHPHLQQQSHGSAFSQLGKGSQGLGTTVILSPVLPEHSLSISQSTKGKVVFILAAGYVKFDIEHH